MSAPAEDFFVSLDDDFDFSRIVVGEPTTHSFTKGETTIEWTTSDVWVEGPNGEHLPVYFEFAEQNFWGISGNWPLGTDPEDQTLDTIKGFQIAYPLTSLATVKNPTPAEAKTRQILDNIWEISVDAMKRFCSVKDKSKRKVPAPTYSSYMAAKEDENWEEAVKPIYAYSTSKDEKTGKKFIDKEKPQKTYIKLITKKEGRDIQCDTKIYGPGDKQVSPFKYMGTPGKNSIRGDGHPVVHWDGIFWGSHGQKAPYGGSNRLRVSEMNFTPTTDSGVPRRRMLSSNTAPAEIDVSDDEGDDGFVHPMGGASSGKIDDSAFDNNDDDNVSALLDSKKTPPTAVEDESGDDEDQATENEEDNSSEEEEEPTPPPKKSAKTKSAKTKSVAAKKREALLAKRKAKASA